MSSLSVPQPQLKQSLSLRTDFKSFAQDISAAALFALERRHLEHVAFD